ncbi:MAG: hypothetical protein KKA84_05040 [Bacteroidetes bacterium]|nr:hypothetical protein [Bacteroidota bacterium]
MKIFFVAILTITINLTAGGLKVKEIDKRIMDHLFNGETELADSLIESQIKITNNKLKYYSIKLPVLFYSRYLSNTPQTRESTLEQIEKYGQLAIAASESMGESVEKNFYLGTCYGYLSRVYGMRQEYWNAFWAAKDCINYLEGVLEDDPDYYDAYMGLAVIEYYTGTRLTGFMGTVAWLTGMSGDRILGMQYFHNVYEKGSLFNTEAHFALATLYRFMEPDPAKAMELMDSFLLKYPKNIFISNNRQRMEVQLVIEQKGIQELIAEKDSLKAKYNLADASVLNTIGYQLVGEEKYDDALSLFKLNIELFPSIANCYDSLAECFMTTGNYVESIKYYKIAIDKLAKDETLNEDGRNTFRERIKEQLKELESLVNS